MYFPIIRGRQYDLLAVRDCLNNDVLSDKIVPIIEPVKATSTFFLTLDTFVKAKHRIAVIINPEVGYFLSDIEGDDDYRERYSQLLESEYVIKAFYASLDIADKLKKDEKCICLCPSQNYIKAYEGLNASLDIEYTLIPDKSEFRRKIQSNKVILEDHFNRKERNADYLNCEVEFFSSDHLFFKAENYVGFSDYSVIGSAYSDMGFAPYAVALHIVYFNQTKELMIAHFVSDTNDSHDDIAAKYGEALGKLALNSDCQKINTIGLGKFLDDYRYTQYSGLGVAKKYSLMHHLELIGKYLDGKI